MAIPRRKLGETGLEVSVIGFGASPLGSVFEDIDEAEGVRSVHRAFELGINFFDTSPFYGITKSETVLGRALVDLPRDKIVVCTKVGRYGPEEFNFSAERVTKSISESLERLQIPYVDIVHCHDIEFGDLDVVVNETLPALQKLKEQGLIRHIGISGLPFKVFKYVLDRAPPGSVDLVLSYCHYCLNDTSLMGMMAYFKEKKVGVINASPLSMGLLTPQGPPVWHPASKELAGACKEAADLCTEKGVNIASLGLKFALREESIATTLSGMCTTAIVEQNVKTTLEACGIASVAEADAKAEEEALAAMADIFKPVKDQSWPSGKPENN